MTENCMAPLVMGLKIVIFIFICVVNPLQFMRIGYVVTELANNRTKYDVSLLNYKLFFFLLSIIT